MRIIRLPEALGLLSRYTRPRVLPRFPPPEGMVVLAVYGQADGSVRDEVGVVESADDLVEFFRRLPELSGLLFFTVPDCIIPPQALTGET